MLTKESCHKALLALAHPGRSSQTARWLEDIQVHALLSQFRAFDSTWDDLCALLAQTGLDDAQIWSRFHPLWSPYPQHQPMMDNFDHLWAGKLGAARRGIESLQEHESLDVLLMYCDLLQTIYSEDISLFSAMLTGDSPWPVPNHTTSFDLWYNRALASMALEDWPDALNLIQRTLSLRPGLSEGWHQLGLIYDRLGRSPEAHQAYDIAIDGYAVWQEVHPDDAFWPYWMASAYALKGASGLALGQLERAIKLAPIHAQYARKEVDFKSLFEHREFQLLTAS